MQTPIDLFYTTIKQKLPDFLYAGLQEYAANSNTYHYQPEVLRQKIAAKYGVPMEYIFLTTGASQAIFLLEAVYGTRTHVFTPTYISYTDVLRLGGSLHEQYVLTKKSYTIPTAAIPDATLIMLANPNNPAGITKRERILELAQNNPHAKVVIDEAYGDFANETVIRDVAKHKNLMVIRSFSKAYALAGYRVGYIVAPPEVHEQLLFGSTWFNVAHTSVGAAVNAMEHETYFSELRQSIITQRQLTEAHLTQLGYAVIPCHINAVVLSFATEAQATTFRKTLKAKGIIVSQGNGLSNYGMPDSFIRIAIGTPEHMEIFRKTVAAL